MNGVFAIYKIPCETPLQALDRLCVVKPEFRRVKLSYAGRLDPMAEGVMLVLAGEENKNREKYLGFDKTYVAEVLLGVATDTADVLGKFKISNLKFKIEEENIRNELGKSVGKFEQKYPAYSSKSFAGSYEKIRKLSQYSKAEKEKSIFSHEVEIYSVELLGMTEIGEGDLLARVKKDVPLVKGDFRQDEIIKVWEENLVGTPSVFQIARIRLSVSSGFYVRQFAEDLGQKLGVPALAFSIVREKVGEWEMKDCIL